MPTYECHVTVDYPTAPIKVQLEQIGKDNAWSTSYINGDPVLGEKRFFYFTCHSDKWTSLLDKMDDLALVIPVPVVRKKIEKIIYDTRSAH